MTQHDQIFNVHASLVSAREGGRGCVPAVIESLEDVRRVCGRWLTWKRIHARLTYQFVAAWLGISARTLLQLECGQADSSTVSRCTCLHLSQILADQHYTPAQIVTIIEIALGTRERLEHDLYTRLQHDLSCTPLPMVG